MTAGRLPPAAAELLAKIAGMLGSNQPGEVFNAAQAATRLLRQHNLTWEALVRSDSAGLAPRPTQPGGWQVDAAFCVAHGDVLNAWEQRFLANLKSVRSPSRKQLDTLAVIHGKALAAGRDAR
jgi:hypothetical protein